MVVLCGVLMVRETADLLKLGTRPILDDAPTTHQQKEDTLMNNPLSSGLSC